MRQIAQIALTRTEAEREQYLRGFHHGHDERPPGSLDSFIRWAYSDPRIDAVPALLAELERSEDEYAEALIHEAEVMARTWGQGRTQAQRVADYLGLLGVESSEQVRSRVASLLPPETPESVLTATIRQMRRSWLDVYGDDPFFAED
jgi:hypothetical protein